MRWDPTLRDSLTHSDKLLQTSPLLKNESIGISLDKNVVFGDKNNL